MPTRGKGGISGSTLTSISDIDTALSVEGMRPHGTDGDACVVEILVLTNNGGAIDLYANASVLQVKQTRRLPLG